MPFCANCDEQFEGQKKNKSACEHCGQINPLRFIENPDEAPDRWVFRNYFEIKARLWRLKLVAILPVLGACTVTFVLNRPVLGTLLMIVTIGLMLFIWGLKRSLLVASQNGETHIFRLATCYGFVLSEQERSPEETGPVVIQLENTVDPKTKEPIDRRIICLDRFTVTGFSTRDGGLRFARILADHCGLKMQRLLGA